MEPKTLISLLPRFITLKSCPRFDNCGLCAFNFIGSRHECKILLLRKKILKQSCNSFLDIYEDKTIPIIVNSRRSTDSCIQYATRKYDLMHEGKETLKQVIILHIRKKITSNYSDEARFTIHFV